LSWRSVSLYLEHQTAPLGHGRLADPRDTPQRRCDLRLFPDPKWIAGLGIPSRAKHYTRHDGLPVWGCGPIGAKVRFRLLISGRPVGGGLMFRDHGFEILESVLSPQECDDLDHELQQLRMVGAGTRNLLSANWCVLAATLRLCPRMSAIIPATHVAVQCTYFEKSQAKNWLVPLHQDLSIPVAKKVSHPALCGWSEKEGAIYVQPPLDVLQNMVAVRLHLDPCGQEDGPIKVVPGSHTLGILGAKAGLEVRNIKREVACLASRGAAVVMHPLVLHASSKATGQSLRRVLHFVFGPRELPYGLLWKTAV
jgi:hypothetical protein